MIPSGIIEKYQVYHGLKIKKALHWRAFNIRLFGRLHVNLSFVVFVTVTELVNTSGCIYKLDFASVERM